MLLLDHALAYASHGWPVFPCHVRGKKPLIAGGFTKATTDPSQVRSWWATWPEANIGVPTGPASGFVVLDIDGERGQQTLEAMIADRDGHGTDELATRASLTGGGGKHLLFACPTPMLRNSQSKLGDGLDIRGEGGYTIVPPSIHESGRAYTWRPADLLPFPEWLRPAEKVRPTVAITPVRAVQADRSDLLRRASAYLATMDAAVQGLGGHSRLYAVATAMVHGFELSRGEALDLLWGEYNPRCTPPWDHASSSDRRDFERKIDQAMTQPHDQPKGWLAAMEYSYGLGNAAHGAEIGAGLMASLRERVHAPSEASEPAATVEAEEPIPQAAPSGGIHSPPPLRTLTTQAPGLLGEFVGWATDTAARPQPEFALAQALAFMGALVGRKVKSYTGLATNVYCVAVGRTADGKDHPMRCVDELVLKAGIEDMVEGEPASDSAIISMLQESRSGAKLLQLDEWGHKLAVAKGRNAAGHQLAIVSTIMELYSAAKGSFRGKAYANRKDRPKVTLHRPCLCLFGTTTDQQLFSTIDRSDVATGFIPRLNIFRRDRSTPQPDLRISTATLTAPAGAIAFVQSWATYTPPTPEGVGNVERYTMPPAPLTIQPTNKAFEVLDCYMGEVEAYRRTLDDGPADALWSRAFEHAVKFATIGACASLSPEEGMPVIDEGTAAWATGLSSRLIVDMLRAIEEKLSENAVEAIAKRVLEMIRKGGRRGVTKYEITKRTQWLDGRQRANVIRDLLEAGEIIQDIRDTKGRKAITFIIRDLMKV